MRKYILIDLFPWVALILSLVFYKGGKTDQLITLIIFSAPLLLSSKRLRAKYTLPIFNLLSLYTFWAFFIADILPTSALEFLKLTLCFFTLGFIVSTFISRPFIANYRKAKLQAARTKTKYFRFVNTVYSMYFIIGLVLCNSIAFTNTKYAFIGAIFTFMCVVFLYMLLSTKSIKVTAWLWNALLPKNPYTNIPKTLKFNVTSNKYAVMREASAVDLKAIIHQSLSLEREIHSYFAASEEERYRKYIEHSFARKNGLYWHKNIDVVMIENEIIASAQVLSSDYKKQMHKKTYQRNSIASQELQNLINAEVKTTLDKSLYISRLYTCRNYRKNGIASQLLSRIEERARVHGFENISLHVLKHNLAALNLYKNFGFIIQSKILDPFGRGNDKEDRYYMVKSISYI